MTGIKLQLKNIMKIVSLMGAAIILTLCVQTTVQAKEYNVVFKAGSKGTVEGSGSHTVSVSYGNTINEALIAVAPQSGYYFTGWSPQVEQVVTKKSVYVAQYAKIIDEAVYRVNYRDTNGTEIATQKVVTTNEGASVTEKAISVAGYQVDADTQNIKVQAKGTELTFTYTSTATPNVITTEENVVVPGPTTTTTTTTGTGTTPATPATPGPAEVTLPDENVPLAENPDTTTDLADTTTLEDEEVPLANQKIKGTSPLVLYGIPLLIGVLLIGAVTYKIKKARKKI